MTIDPKLVAELRALHAKATPGKWRGDHASKGGFVIEGPDRAVLCQRADWPHRAEESAANYQLMVAMRNALPAILDELDAGELLRGVPEPEIVHAIARALYWRDHQPFPWEEVGETSVIDDYTDMGRIALSALKRTIAERKP